METVNLAIPADPERGLPPLLLRPPAERDLDAVSHMYNDPATARWTLVPHPFTAWHRDNYLAMVGREWATDTMRWMVTDRTDDTVLGSAALRVMRRDTAEVLFTTMPRARHKKVATRACHAMARYAFDRLSVERLSWDAMVGNHLSRLIALRLGFRMEGVARGFGSQRGDRVDMWIAALRPGELRSPVGEPPAGYERTRRRAMVFVAPQPTLDTEIAGLRLRPLSGDDVDALYEAGQDAEFARWTTVPQPYERHHAEYFVTGYADAGWRAGTMVTFALADADDRYCGAIDLRLDDKYPHIAEVGFNTAPWARGKGYMTAAVRAVCDFGFKSFDLRRVEWKAFVGNDGSRRVAEKVGFTMEGTARGEAMNRGELVDSWFGAMTRDDWIG
ncbi:MAG TPA: GNAT family N-acetyltransferase [Stackebrandtia sp.]|jgi:RimJ/RimL family protein N-acetyltransferase|uniref:GNAT family N-acetyltransferase n=1 Tax=Stackebrandtia sp. TaxID=2023065 RepID=UPI002D264696|nr:GNAT family N-acetyltransferase [Stackebrandtia sp.]HZE41291.1 GNAT family N-acetyltransferase [Stackebrandtia sp.]